MNWLPAGVGLVLLSLAAVAVVFRRVRQPAEDIIGHALALVERNLPLAPGLTAAAWSATGKTRRSMLAAAGLIAQGVCFAGAVAMVGRLPALELGLLQAAEEKGVLNRGLVAVHERLRRGREDMGNICLMFYYLQLLVVAVIGFGLGHMLTRSENLLLEFAVEGQPAIYSRIRLFSRLFLILWAGVVTVVIMGLFPRRRGVGLLRPFHLVRDWVAWHMPVFGREQCFDQWAVGLDAWAMLTAVGVDAPAALEQVAALDLNAVLRRRLSRWSARSAEGVPLHQAEEFRAAPRMVQWLILSGLANGRLDEALARAAEYCRGQHSRLAGLTRGLLTGLLVLGVSLSVAMLAWDLLRPYLLILNQAITARG